MTCEKERRHREKEARMEKQRLMEEQRNKAALDRALAPPYRPTGRKPVFRQVKIVFSISCLDFTAVSPFVHITIDLILGALIKGLH